MTSEKARGTSTETAYKEESSASTTRSPGHNKEEWHERALWNPTPVEFQAFLNREVEMAKVALRRWRLTGAVEFTSLFSSMTVERARAELRAEGEDWK